MVEDHFRELMACPACEVELEADWSCRRCGARYDAPDDIPNLRLPGDPRVDVVRRFYEEAPFPGYPQDGTLAWLACEMQAAGHRDAGGKNEPIAYGFSWVEHYARDPDSKDRRWISIGNASSQRP